MSTARRRTVIFLLSMTLSFLLIRLFLHYAPNTDFTVAGYNIHHMFTGVLLLILGGIPLIILPKLRTRYSDVAVLLFGVGMSLVLDEWVYRIATDGSNAAYLLPVSLWGAVALVAITFIYTLIVYDLRHRLSRNKRETVYY